MSFKEFVWGFSLLMLLTLLILSLPRKDSQSTVGTQFTEENNRPVIKESALKEELEKSFFKDKTQILWEDTKESLCEVEITLPFQTVYEGKYAVYLTDSKGTSYLIKYPYEYIMSAEKLEKVNEASNWSMNKVYWGLQTLAGYKNKSVVMKTQAQSARYTYQLGKKQYTPDYLIGDDFTGYADGKPVDFSAHMVK